METKIESSGRRSRRVRIGAKQSTTDKHSPPFTDYQETDTIPPCRESDCSGRTKNKLSNISKIAVLIGCQSNGTRLFTLSAPRISLTQRIFQFTKRPCHRMSTTQAHEQHVNALLNKALAFQSVRPPAGLLTLTTCGLAQTSEHYKQNKSGRYNPVQLNSLPYKTHSNAEEDSGCK